MDRYAYPAELVAEINKEFPHVDGLAEILARGDSYAPKLLGLRIYVGERDILELNPEDPATVAALQNTVERNKMIDSFIEQLKLVPLHVHRRCPLCNHPTAGNIHAEWCTNCEWSTDRILS